MKRRLVFRPERCLMCLSCVLACGLGALEIDDPRELIAGSKPPRRLAMTLIAGTPWPVRCRHCTQAPCAEACISGSIVRDEATGAVGHRPETCVGCGSCQLVCPFDAVVPDPTGDCMTKCNLCPQDAVPRCVAACRSGALVLGEGDGDDQRKRAFAREMIGGGSHG